MKKRGSQFDFFNNKVKRLKSNRSGQVSIFVIIAIIIVAGIFLYFAVKGQITLKKIPASLEPLEQYFESCIEDEAERGIEILGTRAGYIYLQEFVPGSEYMPFSSQLDFLGQPVPYWYYVSGNNIVKEQAPSKIEMERQLSRFLEDRITECDFSYFEQKGIFAFIEEPKFNVNIEENKVKVNLNLIFTITNGEETWQIKNLKTEVNSKIGKFYDLALVIYNKEKQEMFLENYAVDILRLYMPVDGVEMSCSPKIWTESDLLEELKQAITVNTERLKLGNKGKDYFAINLNSDESVDFLYSENWPTKLEVEPSESGVLIAEPVGNQPGLGVMGFCYVPYHFIYDLTYPVLIQVYDNKEMFQFPVAVIIDKNKAREAFPVTSVGEQEVELCKYKNNEVVVYTYNNNLEPVEADISFKCFTEKCDIGKTKEKNGDAVLIEKFPQCINGFIIAESEGYETKNYQISTNVEGVADILLDKLYDLDLDLKVENKETEEQTIIYFNSEETEKSKTVVWPQFKSISLSEGFYNVSVYVYTNSELTIPASSERKCVKVPQSGLFGIFGATEEKCYNIDFPEQKISAGITAGGKTQDYITEQELEKGKLEINVESFPKATSLEKLQDNYNLLEIKKAELKFG